MPSSRLSNIISFHLDHLTPRKMTITPSVAIKPSVQYNQFPLDQLTPNKTTIEPSVDIKPSVGYNQFPFGPINSKRNNHRALSCYRVRTKQPSSHQLLSSPPDVIGPSQLHRIYHKHTTVLLSCPLPLSRAETTTRQRSPTCCHPLPKMGRGMAMQSHWPIRKSIPPDQGQRRPRRN